MSDSTALAAAVLHEPMSQDSYTVFAGFKLFGTSAALVIFSQGAGALTNGPAIAHSVEPGCLQVSAASESSYPHNFTMTLSTALPLSSALAGLDLIGDAVRDLLYQGRVVEARFRFGAGSTFDTSGGKPTGYALALKEPTTKLREPGQGSARFLREQLTRHGSHLAGQWAAFNQDGELIGSGTKRSDLQNTLAALGKLKGALFVRL